MIALDSRLPFFAMERNLVLQAGAGTGKTHTLVTLALHLLAGATARRQPIAPARLVALTFTEKAGAEMRERLQHRMRPLAEGASLAREPELARTFEMLGLPAPSAAFWARLRRDVTLASVGTFHSFCAAQLRRFAPEAGLDPAFAVLDEEESRSLFDEAVEGYVRRALAEGDPRVTALVDELGLSDDRGGGLLDLARATLSRLSEEGREPSTLVDARFDDASAASLLAGRTDALVDAVRGLGTMSAKALARLGTAPAEMERHAMAFAVSSQEAPLEQLRALRKAFRKPTGADGAAVEAYEEAFDAARAALARVRAAPLGRAFVSVLETIAARYQEAKAAREALDFSDLQRRLRDLLREDRTVRRELKGRLDALLVDEFQDTSRLQLELVALMAETRRHEAELRSDDLAGVVEWEPGLLCAVGDRKQSIYEFRGADVAVFGALEAALSGPRGGSPVHIEYLQRSFRSRPRLVSCVNEMFRRSMRGGGRSFEITFGESDALVPARADPAPEESAPLVELLEAAGPRAEEQRRDEAARIADRIARMLHDPADPTRVRDAAAGLRRVEGRDITILFRRLTNLDVYRRALAERGLPHVVVGGGGFYDTLEVLDARALLSVLADPWDATASLAVLRGPWCGLSDPELLHLAIDEEGRKRPVSFGRLLRQPPPGQGDSSARLHRVMTFVRTFAPEFDRLGTARLLEKALEDLGYVSVLADGPDRERAAANLAKLREILDRFEARSATPRGALRRFDEHLREQRREPNAAVSEESDARAIRLMSIHQSKGLQFPVVFVADCGARETAETDRLAFDRDAGLALNVRFENGELVAMPELDDVRRQLAARGAAESLRLLYVAATRAQDFLVFSGAMNKGSWLELVGALGPGLVMAVPVADQGPPPAPPDASSPGPTAVLPSLPAPTGRLALTSVTATVTRLQDFALCPERYRLRHEVGLAEHPPAAIEASDDDDVEAPLDVFARGTLAHRLLELLDFPGTPPAETRARLERLVRAEGHDPEAPAIAEICDDVLAFLETDEARGLARLRAAHRVREMPFLLSVGLDGGRRLQIKGKVDLVVVRTDGVRILDYKHARAKKGALEVYGFQLATYAVAVREMLGDRLEIHAGLAFLRERGLEPEFRELAPEELDRHVAELRELGASLMDSYAGKRWARRPRSHCDAIGCGYRTRCHPER